MYKNDQNKTFGPNFVRHEKVRICTDEFPNLYSRGHHFIRIASFNSRSTHIEKLDQIFEDKVGTLSFFMAPKPKKSRGSSSRKGQAKENETDVEANSNSGDSERRYCGNWLSR